MKRTSKLLTILACCVFLAPLACNKDTSKPKADTPTAKEDEPVEPAEALPDAAELLAAHIETAGGVDKTHSFESIHTEGKIDASAQKIKGTSTQWWQKDGKFYVEENIEGVGPTRIGYDGETVWIQDPISGLRKLEGEERVAYLQSSQMFIARDWQEHFKSAKTIGKTTTDEGNEVYEVELESKGGPNLVLGLDAQTKLITYLKTTQVTPMGPMPVQIFEEGYDAVEGYKFPMRKRSSIQGLVEVTEKTTKIEVNVPVDPAIFTYPEELEEVPSDPEAQPPVEAPPAEAPAEQEPGE